MIDAVENVTNYAVFPYGEPREARLMDRQRYLFTQERCEQLEDAVRTLTDKLDDFRRDRAMLLHFFSKLVKDIACEREEKNYILWQQEQEIESYRFALEERQRQVEDYQRKLGE